MTAITASSALPNPVNGPQADQRVAVARKEKDDALSTCAKEVLTMMFDGLEACDIRALGQTCRRLHALTKEYSERIYKQADLAPRIASWIKSDVNINELAPNDLNRMVRASKFVPEIDLDIRKTYPLDVWPPLNLAKLLFHFPNLSVTCDLVSECLSNCDNVVTAWPTSVQNDFRRAGPRIKELRMKEITILTSNMVDNLVAYFPNITSLHIASSHFAPWEARGSINFQKFTRLRDLTFNNPCNALSCQLPPKLVRLGIHLWQSPKHHPEYSKLEHLEELDLSNGAARFSEMGIISFPTTLKKLNLFDTWFKNEDCNILRGCIHLEELNLCLNSVSVLTDEHLPASLRLLRVDRECRVTTSNRNLRILTEAL